MKVLGVILARYASTRFPGKPLANICGKPMIWWVYKNSSASKKIDKIIVATDDKRIADTCEKYNIPFVMTAEHDTAPERLQEVSDKVSADFYIGINGDEPLINSEALDAAIPDIVPNEYEFGTNIITEIQDPVIAMDPSNIKMVFDENMNALYMSRSVVPFPFSSLNFKYYKHVGIIGYNKKMLDFYKNSSPGLFETIEGIVTLRFLDYEKKLKLIIVHNLDVLSVDNPKDIEIVENILARRSNNGTN